MYMRMHQGCLYYYRTRSRHKHHRCGCHLSEEDYSVPDVYLTGFGVNSTGTVRETTKEHGGLALALIFPHGVYVT